MKKKIYIMRSGLNLEPVELEVANDFVKNMEFGRYYPTGLPDGDLQYFDLTKVRLTKAAANRKRKLILKERLSMLNKQVHSIKMSIRGGGMRFVK